MNFLSINYKISNKQNNNNKKTPTIITPTCIAHSEYFLNSFFRNFHSATSDITVRRWKLRIKQVEIELFSNVASFCTQPHFTGRLGKRNIHLKFLTITPTRSRPLNLCVITVKYLEILSGRTLYVYHLYQTLHCGTFTLSRFFPALLSTTDNTTPLYYHTLI